jgi:hypothetical protein
VLLVEDGVRNVVEKCVEQKAGQFLGEGEYAKRCAKVV